jgi:hypothetical protein
VISVLQNLRLATNKDNVERAINISTIFIMIGMSLLTAFVILSGVTPENRQIERMPNIGTMFSDRKVDGYDTVVSGHKISIRDLGYFYKVENNGTQVSHQGVVYENALTEPEEFWLLMLIFSISLAFLLLAAERTISEVRNLNLSSNILPPRQAVKPILLCLFLGLFLAHAIFLNAYWLSIDDLRELQWRRNLLSASISLVPIASTMAAYFISIFYLFSLTKTIKEFENQKRDLIND